jgi:hypothetical protein
MAEPRRWFDSSQPQTLQGATMLCYIIAAFGILSILFGAYPGLISLATGVAGYGVANERRWGYWLGIVLSGLTALLYLLLLVSGYGFSITINLLFTLVLLVLFLHPQSREYQRVWFK